ncbi:membrane protein YdbS with pleckstrin-like domain [Arthrobacter stackebrandtii]|uniref:Membrane protein YdbS with pleckstrin-like domain n=1 Tax=Arthrobacter stackebrandtii TaxID=272161 RepID=A0ABS4YVP6_9MICC|nr:PH domain-containing protein [Arthrobacter stackebrandtii]MBP2412863.1 membrane protein YdbS with pleckstrin-like domain [Arthrobacter stackebrandtii]
MPKAHRSPIDPAGVDFLPVSENLITARLIERGLTGLVIAALTAIPLVLMLVGVWEGYPAWLAWLLPAAVVVVTVWEMAIVPRQVRAMGYAERDEDLLLRSGIMFHKVMVVPYGRMQYVDVSMGPLERMLGLSTIHLHTASPGTNALLRGLPASEASRLREQLSSRGEAKLAGL